MIRIPKNMIITEQYTSGGTYLIKNTNIPYKGSYFVISGVAYSGKEPDTTSKILEKITDRLIREAKKFGTNQLQSHFFDPSKNVSPDDKTLRYFLKKTNETPIIITEIDKITYDNIKNDPGYRTLIINWDMLGDNRAVIESADKTFPGIKIFLS